MKKTDLSRRDFNRLSMAAFGGVVAGTFAGCAKEGGGEASSTPSAPDASHDATMPEGESGAAPAGEETASLLMGEKNVCRGLNICKGHGAGGENACAGTGACATIAAHECAGNNECKGQGGCGTKPGENACKGMGSCAVPLKEHSWGKARANFEAAMKAAGKEVGAAPAVAG
ncbi:MAG: hypothetical protein HQ518_30180 [Rhodopirellula sp.]|nr:hypothetical protein [Rhodopirellula sp.]